MVEDLLEYPWILAVAILVALSVVALFMIPWCRFFQGWRRFFPGAGALVSAIMAVSLADLSFTRWALYDGGGGRSPELAPLSDWLVFAAVNAVISAVAGVVGGLIGFVVALLIEKWHETPNKAAEK